MKVLVVEDESAEKAQHKLASELGIPPSDLRCLRSQNRKFSFEVLSVPAAIEIVTAPDGMKTIWKKLSLPIGEHAPPLTLDFLVSLLNAKGIKAGIRKEVIEAELKRILGRPGGEEEVSFDIVIAEGKPAIPASSGRPKWVLDLQQLEKGGQFFARKGEILARAPNTFEGEDGFKVTGEFIAAPVEEKFRLNIGSGIEVVRAKGESLYVAKTFGQLFYDQGIRLRIEPKIVELEGGMRAAIETGAKSFSGQAITPEDLSEAAKQAGIVFGHLSLEEIERQLKSVKKWPAQILLARGAPAVDGAAGEVRFPYRHPVSDRPVDILKAKNRMVFPGEILALISPPKDPVSGKTVYGETLRGKPYNDVPIFPGKNVVKQSVQAGTVLRSTIYGRVRLEQDRISVENVLTLSPDAMTATLDLFPQRQLSFQDVSALIRERDVLYGVDKEKLERELKEVHEKGFRVENFIVASGKPVRKGEDAKLVYYFNPEHFKPKGLFQKKPPPVFAVLGDLLMEKILAIEAEDGINLFREKIPVVNDQEAKDVRVRTGDHVQEQEVGVWEDSKNPRRIQYRAKQMGTVLWKDRMLDISPTLEISSNEMEAYISFAPSSDFRTRVTLDMLRQLAAHEGIKAELETAEIEKALRIQRAEEGGLTRVLLAKGVEPKHGTDAMIQYFVEYNGRNIESLLYAKQAKDEAPRLCDCVRPKDLLAVKIPAGIGEDGKTIFGKRLPADRGKDELWLYGYGVDRSADKNQIFCSLTTPGFVMVEGGRLVIRNTVRISKDRMSAAIALYPSKNPRFPLREDKVLAMLEGAGVKVGIQTDVIRQALQECIDKGEPLENVDVARGRPPTRGKDASFYFAIDVGNTVGEIRLDGSIDFKSRNIFQNVKKDQLLLIKRPAALGEEGFDVCGNTIPALFGSDAQMEAGEGTVKSENGLEYRSTRDGILEVLSRSIRVIPGLMISEDVSLKTGHIRAGSTPVFVKGGVQPDFSVTSDRDINIEKIAEACQVISGANIRVRGGIVGRKKAYLSAKETIEVLYISSGATVEARGDIIVGSEAFNSSIRTEGLLICDQGAGTICGGEIWTYGGIRVRTLGAAGSETETVIRLGANYFLLKEAEAKIRDEGIDAQVTELESQVKVLQAQQDEIHEKISQASKTEVGRAQELQSQFASVFTERKRILEQIEGLKKKKAEILGQVPHNKDVIVTILDTLHPGVVFIYKDVQWAIKEPLRKVEIRWNPATSNLLSRRI